MAKVKPTMAQGFANGELWNVLSDLVDDLDAIKTLVNDLKAKYNACVTLVNELKADHNAHLGAASMHYNGTAGVTDTVNTTAAANAATTAVADVTPKTTK